jgi:hypothetical protein
MEENEIYHQSSTEWVVKTGSHGKCRFARTVWSKEQSIPLSSDTSTLPSGARPKQL